MASSALAAPLQDVAAEGLVRVEEVTSCPLCGSPRLGRYATSYDRLYLIDERRFVYSRCLDCDLVFQSRRPVRSDIGRLYPANYGPYKQQSQFGSDKPVSRLGHVGKKLVALIGTGLSAAVRTLLPSRFENKYQAIYTPPRPKASLLDFGCGSDKFLNRARKLGWETTGVDFSEIAVEQARRSGHRAHLVSEEMWDQLDDNSFDLVRLSHVLEHLYDPADVLSQLISKMTPGARIHIAVPNPSSISARVMKSYWFSLDCPRHIMLFTPGRLRRLLSDVGFEEISVFHEVVTKDMARSLVYLLYEAGLTKHATIESVIENRFADALLYIPAWIGAACGMGERIHVVATKPQSGQSELR